MGKTGAMSDLQRRIASGEADPISDREREQLAELVAIYERRFGSASAERLKRSIDWPPKS
jgi:hypothetical protein